MPRLAWLTDLHLNFADGPARSRLAEEIRLAQPDHLLVGGDIAEADSFVTSLEWLKDAGNCPLHFVLGNHDYYRRSIAEVRDRARRLARRSDGIAWLPDTGVVRISESAALVGHGGWGDARAGDWDGSGVLLNDYLLIEELRSAEMTLAASCGTRPDVRNVLSDELRARLNALGDEAAASLRQSLSAALDQYEQVYVLMHVPPFREACWHDGRITDDNWAPHFVCQAAGEVLCELVSSQPDRKVTVLCGHTHSEGQAEILPNLTVLTGGAEYRTPRVQRVFEID